MAVHLEDVSALVECRSLISIPLHQFDAPKDGVITMADIAEQVRQIKKELYTVLPWFEGIETEIVGHCIEFTIRPRFAFLLLSESQIDTWKRTGFLQYSIRYPMPHPLVPDNERCPVSGLHIRRYIDAVRLELEEYIQIGEYVSCVSEPTNDAMSSVSLVFSCETD